MFEWYVQVMELMNEKSNIYINNEKIYNAENKLSREEKIEFLDKMNDDKISYMLKLADKFQEDKDKLSKDEYGYYKDASLRAWLKKNDYREIVDTSKPYIGSITLVGYGSFGCGRRNIQNINLQVRDDCHKDFVDELFHRQLKECEKQENSILTSMMNIKSYQKKYLIICINTIYHLVKKSGKAETDYFLKTVRLMMKETLQWMSLRYWKLLLKK